MRNNNFKHIEPEHELPEHVKKETLSNLDTLRLVLDVVDLFCLKANSVWVRSLSSDQETDQGRGVSDEDFQPDED